MNNAGRVGFLVKGDYDSTVTYNFLDVVRYQESSYVAKTQVTGVTPGTDATKWQLLCQGALVDASLSVTGKAADAKATGDKVAWLKDDINSKAPGIMKSASGDFVTINDAAGGTSLKSLMVSLELTQSGSGDPSPSNVRPISGWDAVNVVRAGKNLVPPFDGASATNNGITLTNENGVYTLNGTASGNAIFNIPFPVNLPIGQQYTMQAFNPVADSSIGLFLMTETGLSNPQIQLSGINTKRTIAVTSLKLVALRIRIPAGTTVSDFVIAPVITAGTEGVSDFEPYTGETFPVTLPTTVYGGTLDIVTGKLIVDRVKNTIKWSEYTSKTSLGDYTRGLYRISEPAVYPQSASVPQLSNIAKYKAAYAENSLHFYVTQENVNMFLPNNTDGDTDTEVAYELATPIEYTLTPQDIKALLGTNIIYADCSAVSVEYPIDIKDSIDDIDDLKTELKDIELGEIVLTTGVIVIGYYPMADGTMGANANARTAVFPVKDGISYLISWLTGSNKYRSAFGNTSPDEIVAGTQIYEYEDNASTSHDKYVKKNSNYGYLYVYIGNTATATIDAVEVAAKMKSVVDDCIANDGDQW